LLTISCILKSDFAGKSDKMMSSEIDIARKDTTFKKNTALDLIEWKSDFFSSLSKIEAIFDLFDYFPDVSLFIKNVQGKYLKINQRMAETFGISDPSHILGKSDFDFFPPSIAERYVHEDQQVITSRQPLINRRSYMPGLDGLPLWYQVSKIPLFDTSDKVVGVAGVKYSCKVDWEEGKLLNHRLGKILKYVAKNFKEPITVGDMAAEAGYSISQLQREFRKELGVNPNRYLQDVRVGYGRHLLKTTRASMAVIANECGFYDQSHFSRLFKSATGLSPAAYRAKFTVS